MQYFGARYYRNVTGRFTSVDPVLDVDRNVSDPRQWNRYAYANNNPLRFVDLDGRDPVPTNWQMSRGADGLARVLPAIGKALYNMAVLLNSQGHLSAEGETRQQSRFARPSSTEEAVIMGLTEVAVIASPLVSRY